MYYITTWSSQQTPHGSSLRAIHGVSLVSSKLDYWIKHAKTACKHEIVDKRSTRIPPTPTAKTLKTHATLTFDLLTWKWYDYETHHLLMGCICTTYEYNPWNRQRVTELTRYAGWGWTDGRSDTNYTPPPPKKKKKKTLLCRRYNKSHYH